MIGSFWNLCRACPSMPVDKLHSEYRSTYRWHEYTGNSRPEVVRRPPVPNNFEPINEPPLPRRKKCPELAYKSHEFIIGTADQDHDARNIATINRARSEERGTPSRRSKSEGPPIMANGNVYSASGETEADGKEGRENSTEAGESSGLFKKTISKLSTEYRLQFVWPHVRKALSGQTKDAMDIPRKSLSMGTIKSSKTIAMPTIKKRTAIEKEATVYELEPLVNETNKQKVEKHLSSEEKQDGLGITDHERRKCVHIEQDSKISVDMKVNGHGPYGDQWYKEVIELRKKADEYKYRGWGIEIDPSLYKKQKELWDQVSKRSSLSALSLASSIHRPITKEEKDQANNKKTLPNKSIYKGRFPGQYYLMDNKIAEEPLLPARVQTIRHHLERTTGPDVEEGALLPSPTREKLMPTVPKSKEVDSYSSQKGSPKKSTTSKHGSPQKGSPQKGSPKKINKGRSLSVGPGVVGANESPKRQLRSVSTAPTATVASKQNKKVSATTPNATERKPRPYNDDAQDKNGPLSASSSPQLVQDFPEHIVKSPPEPTRVKSPEQIIMRSPDPVNWTVPLDTGKTFTVTQNVKEGETFSRPQSEVKASTPVEKPPPAPQSAPPELAEQEQMKAWQKDDMGELDVSGPESPNNHSKPLSLPGASKLGLSNTQRFLEDPNFDKEISSKNAASEVLEMARDRFDRFWGRNKEEGA